MKPLWIVFVLLAMAVSWFIGYRARPKEDETEPKVDIPRDYLIGLNFLLNEETDKAVEIFVKVLEVDSDTVETHLAVGKLFRRRGEVDRAIRIHQNLIARPQLERVYREQSLYELGQDYLSAGMLDRAERIFLELVDAKSHSAQALRTLLDIYQQEKDWDHAIEIAKKYENVTRQDMHPTIAHYECELAEQALQKGQQELAVSHANNAMAVDSSCARASLLQAKIMVQQEDYANALLALQKIKEQNPNYLSEAIDLLASCYEKLNREAELEVYLRNLVDEYPRVPVVLILAERIRKWKGDKVAAMFVADYVRRFPSLRGLSLFINIYMSSVQGRSKDDLQILQKLMKKVLASKPAYQCKSCGFAGQSLHWQCPGCRQWSTILPIHSLEEEMA